MLQAACPAVCPGDAAEGVVRMKLVDSEVLLAAAASGMLEASAMREPCAPEDGRVVSPAGDATGTEAAS